MQRNESDGVLLQADGKKWIHPAHKCGRHYEPVPPPEGRHEMWNAPIGSRIGDEMPEVGSRHPCHWAWSERTPLSVWDQSCGLRLVLCVDRRSPQKGSRRQRHLLHRFEHLRVGCLAPTGIIRILPIRSPLLQ